MFVLVLGYTQEKVRLLASRKYVGEREKTSPKNKKYKKTSETRRIKCSFALEVLVFYTHWLRRTKGAKASCDKLSAVIFFIKNR